MDTMVVASLILALHAFVATIAVRALVRDFTLTSQQKLAQCLMALLIPILGPVGIIFVLVCLHDREHLRDLLPFPLYQFAQTRPERHATGHSVEATDSGWDSTYGGSDGGVGD